MSRIRTIKPEFWTSDQISACSRDARLLFIGMWNFADDEGNLVRSAKQIKARVFPNDDIDCEPLLQELITHGLLNEYSVNGHGVYLNVGGFKKHQIINRPSKPHCPLYEDSLRTHGALITEGKEGKEGKGTEGASTSLRSVGLTGSSSKRSNSKPQVSNEATGGIWAAYSQAYDARYGVEPVRNAKVNTLLALFAKRLPAAEAPEVAAFYVRHNGQFYVRAKHPVGLLLQDAEGLRTEWATGKTVTATEAVQADKTQARGNAFAPLIAEARKREALPTAKVEDDNQPF